MPDSPYNVFGDPFLRVTQRTKTGRPKRDRRKNRSARSARKKNR